MACFVSSAMQKSSDIYEENPQDFYSFPKFVYIPETYIAFRSHDFEVRQLVPTS